MFYHKSTFGFNTKRRCHTFFLLDVGQQDVIGFKGRFRFQELILLLSLYFKSAFIHSQLFLYGQLIYTDVLRFWRQPWGSLMRCPGFRGLGPGFRLCRKMLDTYFRRKSLLFNKFFIHVTLKHNVMKLQRDEINYIGLKIGVNIKVNVICNSRFSFPFYG